MRHSLVLTAQDLYSDLSETLTSFAYIIVASLILHGHETNQYGVPYRAS